MTIGFRAMYSEDGVRSMVEGRSSTLAEKFPFYPLNSEGFPPAGKDFLIEAAARAGDVESYAIPDDGVTRSKTEVKKFKKSAHETELRLHLAGMYYRALYDDEFQLNIDLSGRFRTVELILGHLWGSEADGPRAARIMVVGKNPGREEASDRRCFTGPTSQLFREVLEELGFSGLGDWYVTNVVRFPNPLAHQTSEVKAAWINDCLPLLHQELRLVRPTYLLLLGTEAIASVLGKGSTYKSTNGRINHIRIPLHGPGEPEEYHDIQVVSSIHPAAVAHDPSKRDELYTALRYFRSVIDGTLASARNPEEDNEHLAVIDAESLNVIANQMEAEGRTEFAIDCEFDGDSPIDGKLHTVQFSWEEHKACVADLRDTNGKPSFGGGMEAASRILSRILKGPNKRLIGHYFNADLWWLKELGLWFLEDQFEVPGDDPNPDGVERLFGWQKLKTRGGFDTILAAHAHEETAELGLKDLAIKYTTAGNYGVDLEKWKRLEALRLKCGIGQLPGFGACPRAILLPYALYDADCTFRLYKLYNERGLGNNPALLDHDRFGKSSRMAFWISMRACLAAYEMRETGMFIDVPRAEELFDGYTECKEVLLYRLQQPVDQGGLGWPDFNPSSIIHCKEFLFGTKYNGKIDKTTGENQSVRPEGALTLNLTPYKSTGKRPKLWDQVKARGKEEEYSPSTDKETLEVYQSLHPTIKLLLNMRYIQTVTRTVLQPPRRNQDDTNWEIDDEGNRIYDRGLLSYVQSTGRVYTNISQTKETGRWSTWQPPTQNISKKREPTYREILGVDYKYPLRSIFVAPPTDPRVDQEPWVLVTADYSGAELFGMGIQARETQMISHCRRMLLPDDGYTLEGMRCTHGDGGKPLKKCKSCVYPHPDYYDIHANVAVTAFRPVNKETGQPCRDGRLARFDLKAAKLGHYRDAAKPVDFGYAYGMTADAAYRRAREGGADVTKEDSQALLDGLERLYPCLPVYYGYAAARSHDPGYIVNCYGRRRRTYHTDDLKAIGEIERQFKNFPIQSLVADAMSIAVANFRDYRRTHPHLRYRLALAVHDDVISLVPVSQVEEYCDEVIPECMTRKVDVWPCDLEGNRLPDPDAPYHLSPDIHVYRRWGVGISPEEATQIGLPLRFAGKSD